MGDTFPLARRMQVMSGVFGIEMGMARHCPGTGYGQRSVGSGHREPRGIPSGVVSEHPTASIRTGQAYVTSLINEIGRGRQWKSKAVFLAWDDRGGFTITFDRRSSI